MKRRDEFVVGGRGAQSPLWGSDRRDPAGMEIIWPMTAYDAPRVVRDMEEQTKRPAVIYRLVPVSVAKVKAQAARERKARKGKR